MLVLNRIVSDDLSTRGVLVWNGIPVCYSLELPWRGNSRNVSCIPNGDFIGRKVFSSKFGNVIHILGDFDRDGILIHPGIVVGDTRGCILPGLDVNAVGVLKSGKAMVRLLQSVSVEFDFKVRSFDND